MNVNDVVFDNVKKIIKQDRKNVFNLIYYSVIDALLVLSIPLASSFVINSILAHASFSIYILGFIILVLFVFVTILQVIKEYIIEKFQQKLFIKAGIEIALKAMELRGKALVDPKMYKKLMNYFFDVTAIQKVFPILLLDGLGVGVKMLVSMLLLLAFNPLLFVAGIIFFTLYFYIILFLGRNGIDFALNRSDAKHSTIYFLQHIKDEEGSNEEILQRFDSSLSHYAKARQKFFKIIIKQLALTYFIEGLIFSIFLILGGYLVIIGTLPLGEFVAAEIIVTSITYSLKGFVKQLDYIYDTIEGFYKIHKLSVGLEGQNL
ncbi:MAG TPA: ABC transporter ATP-binding protein [Sulfurovum sp.]|jgi:ABC-type bacteriocin/lantibiotic exporter with double-glycine peptidase domain|nr:MAG: ABC transporter ATP-binding protein [Sulfurovum sp. 35-42-20]OYZ25221.1 MAG: ABC transporter ATP-binding protein [Sulfurovum sp. 16-42-52]OYZ50030.1 MAG: ABC transporter ATP-binding protein [Sulfurovum sp. 24-42-9]OZA45274.1 MAG: ABC transporter ATP-binding protein [Sulfurovum sp. 17-42-90]HQR72930.1 ABC transporter ATP-binding protein [Sulfurovum sp.]